ncbi:hypothetical protein EJ02DRAFT_487390 [Clathrospora elynae]|uniref:Uncharacterized protein n=1 Tax=Clathrospora elynae TaxID=706981 RepID=A0A6A5T1T0_9PLEO|nr:hypothetical protein EJ02DRAFT_487390 [Clathrospora elynae]
MPLSETTPDSDLLSCLHRYIWVMCLWVVKVIAQGHIVAYEFGLRGSKKCVYCTAQKDVYTPVPVYVREEFAVLLGTLEEYQGLPEGNNNQAAALAEVQEVARTLSLCVQVIQAQDKTLGVPELLTASHHLLGQVLEQVSALNCRIASLEAQVARGVSGGSSSRSQKKKRGKVVVVELDNKMTKSE